MKLIINYSEGRRMAKLKPGDSMWTTAPDKAYNRVMGDINQDEQNGYLSKNQANHLRKVAARLREKGKHHCEK